MNSRATCEPVGIEPTTISAENGAETCVVWLKGNGIRGAKNNRGFGVVTPWVIAASNGIRTSGCHPAFPTLTGNHNRGFSALPSTNTISMEKVVIGVG